MTLEDLKIMKERAENLCQTFYRDREILQEEKNRTDREVSNNLEKLLQEIKDFVNLISLPEGKKTRFIKDLPDGTECEFIHCSYYTRIFLYKKQYGTLAITYIYGVWQIKVSERLFLLGKNSLEDILIPIFLQNKDSILSELSYLVASSIEQSLQEEKNKNDKLYENIQKAKAVI